MTRPFFFGDSARQLYGVYHPPRARAARAATAVLICSPFGQEYMRTHRALRQLATQLARIGCHVMRFDYFGTGDSAGDGAEVSPSTCVADIGTAIQELKDTAGVARVSLVGLRLGALLAAAAAGTRDDVDEIVCWDPIVSGRQYLDELFALYEQRHRAPPPPGSGILGIEGFPLTTVIQRELSPLELGPLVQRAGGSLAMVASEPRPEYSKLAAACREQGRPIDIISVDAPARWDDLDRLGAVLLPQAAIQAIVARYGGNRAHA